VPCSRAAEICCFRWLKPDSPLHRDITLDDVRDDLLKVNVSGGILIEATNTPEEISWLLKLTEADDRCWGVIGWIHLEQPNAVEQINHFAQHPNFKGVRLNWLAPRSNPERLYAAMHALQDRRLVVDVLARPELLPDVAALIRDFPQLTFVLNHMGGSSMTKTGLEAWCDAMQPFVPLSNMRLKVSGYTPESYLSPYLQVADHCFGVQRLLFGSNYPLCVSYTETVETLRQAAADKDAPWQAALFRETALTTYNLHSREQPCGSSRD